MIDKKRIALIHIIKKELKMSDKEYRSILRQYAGVESAKELDEQGFRKLMYYFVHSSHYRINPYGLTIRQKLFIDYLVRQLGWTKEHLNNFLHKYYRKSRVLELSKEEAIKVIESLKNIKDRQR